MEKAGRPERVDHRSLKDRGIDRIPEPKIGQAAAAMKRRGVEADPKRFQLVRYVKLINDMRPHVRTLERLGQTRPKVGQVLWFERSRLFMARLRENVSSKVKDAWQSLIGTRQAREQGRERDITR